MSGSHLGTMWVSDTTDALEDGRSRLSFGKDGQCGSHPLDYFFFFFYHNGRDTGEPKETPKPLIT